MSNGINFDKYGLLERGVFSQHMTTPFRILSLIEKLRPVTTWRQLIRVGSDTDGGYLVPDDLKGISACMSAGAGPSAAFEMDLKKRFGIDSHLSNISGQQPPQELAPLSFQTKLVGTYESDQITTLDKWIGEKAGEPSTEDLLLQIDVEGGEYPALLSLSESNLKRFRIVVAEIHHIENWCDPAFFDIVEAMFTKLLKHFHVVHIHPNNYAGLVNMGGIMAPRVFEISFLRRDRAIPTGFQMSFPHPLDRPCNPNQADLVLPRMWFARARTGNAAAVAPSKNDQTTAEIFDDIYKFALWGRDEKGEAISGYGSHEGKIIGPYVKAMRRIMPELGCSTIADLGCGDFNVGKHLVAGCTLYLGCDVSQFIIARNRKRYVADNLKFLQLDLANNDLPRADLAMVRQVLQHLSNSSVKSFVDCLNDAKPYRYLVVTEHVPKGDFVPNADIGAGHDTRMSVGSGIELHEAPFGLLHKSRNVLIEIPADTHGRSAVIRTTLYEF